MDYEEFVRANRGKLVGYFLIASLREDNEVLDIPDAVGMLDESLLSTLKERLKSCMPLDTTITDLWDWDVHFEEDLDDDWYFQAAFGSSSSLDDCSTNLADFFLEKCAEYGMDYNETGFDTGFSFSDLIREEATKFIVGWRQGVLTRFVHDAA